MDFNKFHGTAEKGSIYIMAGLGESFSCLTLPAIGLLRSVRDILVLDGPAASVIAALGLSKRCEDLSASSQEEAAFIASAAAGAGSSVAVLAMACATKAATPGFAAKGPDRAAGPGSPPRWVNGLRLVLTKASSRGVPVLVPCDMGSLTMARVLCPFDFNEPLGSIPVPVEEARKQCTGTAEAMVLGLREEAMPLFVGPLSPALEAAARSGARSVCVLERK